MRSMKKTFGLCLLLLLMTVLLSSCHGAQEKASFEMPTEFDTSRHFDITFWAKNDTNKAQTDIYAKAIQEFEALYPNVTVNIRLYTDYGRIYNDVITNISTNSTPNVCVTYPDHIATYKTGKNVVMSLDTLMQDSRYGLGGSELKFDSPKAEEIVPQFLNECRIGSQYYALPYMRSTEACYINKTLVNKLGYEIPDVLTWDFIWEVSEAAMAQDAEGNYLVNGQKVLIPFIYKSTDNMMISMLRQLNAGYSDDAGHVLIFNDETRKILETVYKYAGMRAFSTFQISSYPANFLNAGQCLFAVDSTAGATWMGAQAPLLDISSEQLADFETEVRMIPQYDTENVRMISQGPSICVFSKEDPQEVLASWLFAQFMLTNDVQIAYSGTEGYVPVTLKAQQSEAYQEYLQLAGTDNNDHYDVKIKAASLLLNHAADTFVTPVFNGSASLRNAAGQLIEEAAKAARRKQNLDIAGIESNVSSLYRLDSIQTTDQSEDGANRKDEPLPTEAKVLIGVIIGIWVLLIVYRLLDAAKAKKKK